jgi:hypothetical protein
LFVEPRMAEAFVKTFKRDVVYLADGRDATTVMKQLPEWFEEDNEAHPHKGLRRFTPCDFRCAQSHLKTVQLDGATPKAISIMLRQFSEVTTWFKLTPQLFGTFTHTARRGSFLPNRPRLKLRTRN